MKRNSPASNDRVRILASLGTRFFDADMVESSLGTTLIEAFNQPFTEAEIIGAFARGERLIWYPVVNMDDEAITMMFIHNILSNIAPLGGRILNDVNPYIREPFFTTETARVKPGKVGAWRLVGTKPIPGTIGVNFLEQTVLAARYVQYEIYGGKPPTHLKSILSEPQERGEEIARLMRDDWKKASRILAMMPFNIMFRDTPIEVMIRIIVNQKINGIRLLEKKWSWTSSLYSNGDLVALGGADSIGSSVHGRLPGYSNARFGFFLSHSVVEESES